MVIPDAAPAIVKLDPPWIVDVALTNPVILVFPAPSVVIPDTAPENEPVLADNTQRCVLVPNAVPTVFENGLTPVPPEDVIPAGVIATLTELLPSDIVVALANNPFEVALIVPEPKPELAFTWPVIVAPAVPVIKPEKLPV